MTRQWLSVPWLFEAEVVPERYRNSWIAREQNSKAPGLNAEAMAGMIKAYQVSRQWTDEMSMLMRDAIQNDTRSPMFCPLNSGAQTKDLPKAYIQVCGMVRLAHQPFFLAI